MDARTLYALKKSVFHWEYNATVKDFAGARIGPQDCALCMTFNPKLRWCDPDACIGCPVSSHTGKTGCKDTPYVEAEKAFEAVDALDKTDDADEYDSALEAFRNAAKTEADFLRSLLPKEG